MKFHSFYEGEIGARSMVQFSTMKRAWKLVLTGTRRTKSYLCAYKLGDAIRRVIN